MSNDGPPKKPNTTSKGPPSTLHPKPVLTEHGHRARYRDGHNDPAVSNQPPAKPIQKMSTSKPTTYSINPFRRMIRKVATLLSLDDVNEMMFLTGCSISDETKYRQMPLYYLIDSLKEDELITENNVDILLELLREIKSEETLSLVESYKNSLGDRGHSTPHSVSECKKPVAPAKPIQKMSTSKPTTSSINPLRRMIRKLATLLSLDDVNEMMFLIGCSISDETKYRQMPLYYLIDSLKEDELITENNVDILLELLREIKSEEALSLVESYKQSLGDGGHSTPHFVSECKKPVAPAKPIQKMSTSKPTTSFINPLRRMIRKVATLLSLDDVNEMMFLTGCSISDETKYRQMPLYYLIDSLKEDELITENNVDILLELLREIKSEEALSLVESYKQSLGDRGHSTPHFVSECKKPVAPAKPIQKMGTSKLTTSFINPFQRMIRKVATLLSLDDVNEMMFLTGCSISDETKYRQMPLYYLIDKLKEDELITENNVDILLELLREIKSEEALSFVESYKNPLGDRGHSTPHSVSECKKPVAPAKPIQKMGTSKPTTSFINPFQSMIRKVATLLSLDDVNEMMFLTGCSISDETKYRQMPLYYLIDSLKEDELITENNVDILLELLREIKSEEALSFVESYKNPLGDRGHSTPHSVSECKKPVAPAKPIQKMGTSKPTTSFINPFQSMIRKVATLLSLDDVNEMMFLTGCSISDETKYRQMPLYYLIDSLKEDELITENNVDILLELLREIKSEEALSFVESYKNPLGDRGHSTPHSVSECKKPVDSKNWSNARKQQISKQLQQSEVSEPDNSFLGTPNESSNESSPTHSSSLPIFQNLNQILSTFGISNQLGKQLGVIYCMTLDEMHLKESSISSDKIVIAFLAHLISYDYRAMRLFKELEPIPGFTQHDEESFRNVNTLQSNGLKLSCRDMTFVILNCCDPFLKQEVLSKMTSCQLAVPVLLPTLDQMQVVLLLWGLQRIKKAWKDPEANVLRDELVVQYPFPVVSVLRVGNADLSKSNILNKMLGPIQNNDDHPYYLSSEQDSRQSILSQGCVEGVWYLPGSRKKGKYSLLNAICFLNLRGDAEEFHKQRNYVSKFSTLTIVFISKSSMPSKTHIIKEIALTSMVVLVVCGRGSMSSNSIEAATGKQITLLDASGRNTLDIGEYLCTEVNKVLLQQGNKSVHSLDNSFPICSDSKIDVDMRDPVCSRAKQAARDILSLHKAGPKKFKSEALPLQLKWQKWSKLDKDRRWTGVQGNTEKQLADLQHEKEEQRKQQREIGMSQEIKKLYQELSDPDERYKQFLVFWLQHFLNEKSVASLKPLVDALKCFRHKVRETAAKITFLKRKLDDGSGTSEKEREKIEINVQKYSAEEATLNENLIKTTNEFDACSLGFEHFIREFGQLYECFHKCQHLHENVTEFDVKSLPRMVAGILVNGHPVEIFDGDACHVPIKWIRGVLFAVSELIGNCRIYVISVIGIQSSGKSTLLNSMFGVRFAVSAGRCTRGIFLQLLPIDGKLKKELGCDYIAVIDTEGLKAPEKIVANRKNEDNELATFALCISDMTLINIGGQTVGEDLSNILQISAHAFIRMKEVNLRSSCYLIQQFVADVTASQRNHSGTQSILQILDQAVATAATEEGKQDQYRQFADCFNIINLDGKSGDVQYVPNLWRTAMSAPNYEYSETVLQLKSALLRNAKHKEKKQTISEFADRIASVWNAVKQEDFVFNFRNTTEIAQYSNFTSLFKRAQMEFTKEMMKWELDAKQKIRNTAAENVINLRDSLFQELNKKLTTEIDQLHKIIDQELRKREYESVRQHATYFTMDLDFVEKQLRDNIMEMLSIESSKITDAKTKEKQLLPQMKAKLRQQVLPVAEKLKQSLSSDISISQKSDFDKDAEIQKVFEVEWSKQMKDVKGHYPTDSEDNLKGKIENNIELCIIQSLANTDLSKEMRQLLSCHKLRELCCSSPDISKADDIPNITHLIRTCNDKVKGHLQNLLNITNKEFGRQAFLFSIKFVESIRGDLTLLLNEKCDGCKEKTGLLICLICQILFRANKVTLNNVLHSIITSESLLKRLNIRDVATKSSIEASIKSQLKGVKLKQSQDKFAKIVQFVTSRVTNWLFVNNEVDDDFFNDLKTKFDSLLKQHSCKRYSERIIAEFLDMTLNLIHEKGATTDKSQQLLSQACGFFIQEALQCEKNYLSKHLPWHEVKQEFELDVIEFVEQKDLLLHTLQNILPEVVVAFIRNMQLDDVKKLADIDFVHRHVLDQNFLSLVPKLSTPKYDTILSIIEDSQDDFLTLLYENDVYNTNTMRSVITTTMEKFKKTVDIEKKEQVLTIAFVCSWSLPICQAMAINFMRGNSMESLLEQEREHLYLEFRDLCSGACQDQLEAKSLSSIIEVSLTEIIKNRLCSSLFEQLTRYGGDIFCSRARFLQVVLKSLCLKENFHDYTSFISQHKSFITKWTLNYIATQCSNKTKEGISIRDIAVGESDQLLRMTENSLQAALRSIQKSSDQNISFANWLEVFTQTFENSVKSTLNEESISGLKKYTSVSDFDLFTEECVKNIKEFTQSSLLESLCLPDTSNVYEVEIWFEKLPKQIHLLMAEQVQGCGSRCPFCKTFCDDTVKEHEVHFSNLHRPAGIGGTVNKASGQLICETCTADVASEKKYYKCGCPYGVKCDHKATPYKNYKTDYPEWHIQPIADYEPTLYWKWVLTTFNKKFAMYYKGKPAQTPWGNVTKGQALSSIEHNN